MEVSTAYFLVLLITLLGFYLWKKFHEKKIEGKPVPGPSLISGIGQFIRGSLAGKLHLYVPEWAEMYGNFVQVNLLLRKAIFINDAETFRRLVKDSELRDLTNDRPETFYGKYYTMDSKGIILEKKSGSSLQKKRKIFHGLLKFHGEGRGQFEELMITTLTNLTEDLKSKDTIELSLSIKTYIRRLVGFLLDGDISSAAQVKSLSIDALITNGEKLFLFENETVLSPFPFLRFIPGLRFKAIHEAVSRGVENMMNAYFYPVKNTFDSSRKRGMVHELIDMQRNLTENNFYIDDDTIKALILDVGSAAYATTRSTLASLFLYLIKNQTMQDQIYDEIKRVIGDSTPSFQHKQLMPFIEAVTLETLRISSNMPFLLPHFARKDMMFDGYYIPKSTILMMNAWYSHHREDYWEDPFTFKPERFLTSNGQLVEPDHPARQRLIPFGVGRRGCPGETFAKSRVFLITTFLLQRFQFLPDENHPLPSSDPRDWKSVTVLYPDNYACKIKQRCDEDCQSKSN